MVMLQLIINGLITGAIYALVSSGFSLVYSTCKFIHFAHGAVIALTSYMLYTLFSIVGLNFGFAVILAIIFASLFGYSINYVVYKHLRKRKASNLIFLITSFVLLILSESLILIIFGANVKSIGYIQSVNSLNLFGALITPLQIVIIITAIILVVTLFVFMKKTKTGKAIRAVSNNKNVAEILGINSERIRSITFVLASALAGVAGILIGLEQSLEPMMGSNLIFKGFTASVIGGIGNVPGAIIGAFILGITENVSVWFLPSAYRDAITFIILFIFLVFRPQGLFGKKRRILE